MAQITTTLPRWNMDTVYPGASSEEFRRDAEGLRQAIHDLARLFDEHGVAEQQTATVDERTVTAFEEVLERYNSTLDQMQTLFAYVYCLVSSDSRDAKAQARLSELEQQNVLLSQLGTRFTAWIGSLDVDALIGRSTAASEHAFALRQAKVRAEHLMSPAEEELAAELHVTGANAWDKLHGNLTSQISVQVDLPAGARELPMSVVRSLAFDPDRDTRRAGYEAELKAWERAAVPLNAALNSIKGESAVLSRRRRWGSPLEQAVFGHRIDQPTLDAMLSAARESFPDFRRYLRAKARLLEVESLAWYDLFAPVGGDGRAWSYEEAMEFIVEQFGVYSDRLSEFAARAFREDWIDAEPRDGKVDGAFCISIRRDESRVLTNYKPVFDAVSTLAHELGHAYHNLNRYGRTAIQRSTPMTLAETASIFCETIIRDAGLASASEQEQLSILEGSLQGSCQVVVDITSRFQFEQAVYEGRSRRELSAVELNELMLDAQRDTYGNGLDQEQLHPYMWAVKPHYYSSDYYNYPYMFGLLFGLGLYAEYQAGPERFRSRYDDLLAATGLADAAELAGRFGIDIRTPEFWRSSLNVIRQDVDHFERLVSAASSQ